MCAFPLTIVEGDDAGIAVAAHLVMQGKEDPFGLGYGRDFQRGVIEVVAFVTHLTGSNTFTVLAVLSLLCAFANTLLIGEIAHRMTSLPRWLCLLFCLLFQEVVSLFYYATSTNFSALFLFIAWLLLLDGKTGRSIAAAVCFAVAVWLRLDALIAGAVFPTLILLRTGFNSAGLRSLLRFGVTWVLALSALSLLSGVDFSTMAKTFAYHRGLGFFWWHNLQCFLAFFSFLLLFLITLGFWRTMADKNYRLLLPFLALALPLLVTLWGNLSSPKYLFYITPWACALAVTGIRQCQGGGLRRGLLVAAVFLGAVQYVIPRGITRETLAATGLSLGPATLPASDQLLHTDDAARQLHSIIAAPLFWLEQKQAAEKTYAQVSEEIRLGSTMVFGCSDWVGREAMAYLLLSAGYECVKHAGVDPRDAQFYVWENPKTASRRWMVFFPSQAKNTGGRMLEALTLGQSSQAVFLYSNDRWAVGHRQLRDLAAAGLVINGGVRMELDHTLARVARVQLVK